MIVKFDCKIKNASTLGGIDLNPQLMNFQIKRDQNGRALDIRHQDVERINIRGLVPTIMEITPLKNPAFMLISQESDSVFNLTRK